MLGRYCTQFIKIYSAYLHISPKWGGEHGQAETNWKTKTIRWCLPLCLYQRLEWASRGSQKPNRSNSLGIEGQIAHFVGGISRSFDDLPDSIKATIISHRISRLTKMVKANEIQGKRPENYCFPPLGPD